MNKEGRKYLTDKVREQFKIKIKALEDSIPQKPDLQAYIITEIMEGRLKLKSNSHLKSYLESKVRNIKQEQKIIMRSEELSGRSWRENPDDEQGKTEIITIPVRELLEIPASYTKEFDRYVTEKKRIKGLISELQASLQTIELKIQVGSPEKLQRIVDDIDNLGELSLVGLQLGVVGDQQKQLTEGKKG